MKRVFDFKLRDTYYQEALNYIRQQELENAMFKKKMEDYHVNTRKQKEEITKKSKSDGTGNLNIEQNFETLSEKMECMIRNKNEVMSKNFNEKLEVMSEKFSNKIDHMSKSISNLDFIVKEILIEIKTPKNHIRSVFFYDNV